MDKATACTFPFLSLPLEIRTMIYHESFSQRRLILADTLGPTYGCGRRYRDFCLENPSIADGSTIPLLQVCKQILSEAQSLHSKYIPSHLILSRDLHKLPFHNNLQNLQHKIGLPMSYIAELTIDARSFGDNKPTWHKCPELPVTYTSFGGTHFSGFEPDGPPPDPERLPNLVRISYLSPLVNGGLPALREVHIENALERGLDPTLNLCDCPIAGTPSCACGKCFCTCIIHSPIPPINAKPPIDIEPELHAALLSRYRAALPPTEQSTHRPETDYDAILQLLERGVNVYLHDKVEDRHPPSAAKGQHKHVWHVTYHLGPLSTTTISLADIPSEVIKSPRQRQLEGEAESQPSKTYTPSFDSNQFTLDLSTLENVDVLEHFDFDSFLNSSPDFNFDYTNITVTSESPTRPLTDFEKGLRLELVGQS